MTPLDDYLEMAITMHRGCLCPGQVLGTCMALLGCRRLGIDPPDQEKRLFAFVEMDRCFADARESTTDGRCRSTARFCAGRVLTVPTTG